MPLAVLRTGRLEDDAEPLNAEGTQQQPFAENVPEQRSDETNQILSSNGPDPAFIVHPDSELQVNGSETGDMAGHASVMEPDAVPQANGAETEDMDGHAVIEPDAVPQANGSETGGKDGRASIIEQG